MGWWGGIADEVLAGKLGVLSLRTSCTELSSDFRSYILKLQCAPAAPSQRFFFNRMVLKYLIKFHIFKIRSGQGKRSIF